MIIDKMNGGTSLNQVKNFITWSNFGYVLLVIAILLAIIFIVSTYDTNSSFLALAYAMTSVSAEHAYIEKLYIESDGTSHVYGFKLCAGDEPLHFAKILISSDSEIITLSPDSAVSKGDCRIFGVHINAKNAESIEAKLIEPIRV